MAKEAGLVTKSNLILGMGEEEHEIDQAMHDLHEAGCDILTITQYLRPSPRHHPIDRWVKPEEFVHWSERADEIGFIGCHGRAARALVLPGRPALGHGDEPRSGARSPSTSPISPRRRPLPARQEAAAVVARSAGPVS